MNYGVRLRSLADNEAWAKGLDADPESIEWMTAMLVAKVCSFSVQPVVQHSDCPVKTFCRRRLQMVEPRNDWTSSARGCYPRRPLESLLILHPQDQALFTAHARRLSLGALRCRSSSPELSSSRRACATAVTCRASNTSSPGQGSISDG